MAASLGKFQVFESQSWSGTTTKNHLGAIYRVAPQRASNIITKLLAYNYAPTLDTMLSKFPVKYFETDDEFTWDLIGSLERNYPLVEARIGGYDGTLVSASDNNVGAGGEAIYLVFAEQAFHDVNVIVGEKNEIYPLKVLEDPKHEAGNYVYKVELMGGVINGMPGAELVAGKRFSKDFSPVEDTLSIKGGDINFSSPIALRNEFSMIRMQHKAPGNMKRRPLVLPFEFENPKTGKVEMSKTWMEHVEWKFEYEFAMEKSRLLMFARTNRSENGDYYNIGKSGHVIKMGSGIREQMEVSNTTYYNEFSIKLLTNMLTELSEGKLSMDERHFVLRTGERGAVQFHEAVKQDVSGWLPVGFDNTGTNSIQKATSPLHGNAYKAGFQFVEWAAPNGIKVTLEVDPFYDDKVRNKVLHPKGGVAESYRYDILDIGTIDGEPNIQKAMVKGMEDIRGWEYGLRNPFPSAPEFAIMSNAVDGSTYHRAFVGGAIVRDPSRTASLIPSILAG
jgi:hypothetical protein